MEYILEVGSNFVLELGEQRQSEKLQRALNLITKAAAAGGDIVKFQAIRAEQLYRDPDESLYEVEIPHSWYPVLAECAEEHDIEFMCTPFYLDAIDVLDPYVERWKIASWDINCLPILDEISKSSKPVILSTASATEQEIDRAITILNSSDITLMHCNPGYPTESENAELDRINMLKQWGYPVGYSSHVTNPYIVSLSTFYGVSLIEVHFDLGSDYFGGSGNRGVESTHSYNIDSFGSLKYNIELIEKAREWNPEFNEVDLQARKNYRRDNSDWLRPTL